MYLTMYALLDVQLWFVLLDVRASVVVANGLQTAVSIQSGLCGWKRWVVYGVGQCMIC